MSEILLNSQIIINSNNELILFQTSNNGKIKYHLYDNSHNFIKDFTLHKENVLRYSVSIDEKDIIHLISLMKTGELIYSIYKENTWSNAIISKFDIQSNLYSNIKFDIFKKNINIIYNYTNLINSNLWAIHHVIGHKQNWAKYNVISYISNKKSSSFYFDIDSFGNIHLLYTSMEKNNFQIYHTFYNTFAQNWNQIPQKISNSNTNKIFPYLFIDTQNNIHTLWLESTNNNILKYYKLNFKEQEKNTWKQIKIPCISNCKNTPIMFEENGMLKIVYIQNNNIGYLYSQNYGDTWYKGNNLKIETNTIYLAKISNNLPKHKNIKINHLYCSINKQLTFYFLDTFKSINKIHTNNYLNENGDETIDVNSKLAKPEQINIKNLELKIDQLLLNQEKILAILDEKKNSFFNKLFNSSKN